MTPTPFSVFLQPASSRNPMVPAWLDATLARALSRDASKRFGDMAEFSDALTRTVSRQPMQSARPASLLERDPLRFWQMIAAALAVANLVWLVMALF